MAEVVSADGISGRTWPEKIHNQPIPLAGGLAVMTGLLLPVLLASLVLWWEGGRGVLRAQPSPAESTAGAPSLAFPLSPTIGSDLLYGLERRGLELAAIFFGALGMLAVGWLDDKRELSPAVKFGGQLLVAAIVAASGARITLFVNNVVFSYAVTMLWILTVTNAFNFMDNMNGLCAGLGVSGSGWLACLAVVNGQHLVALIAMLTFGALLGFLPYNFPRARVFLGDSGSHLVGYLLAVLCILPHFYSRQHPQRWAVLIPLSVLAVTAAGLVLGCSDPLACKSTFLRRGHQSSLASANPARIESDAGCAPHLARGGHARSAGVLGAGVRLLPASRGRTLRVRGVPALP